MSGRGRLWGAAVLALVASAGDGMLLYVVNARRPELALAAPAPMLLPLGTVLGVVAIPFYALGYRAVGAAMVSRAPVLAAVVGWAGSLAALVGAVIHGLTGRLIAAEVAAGAPARPPAEAMMAWTGSPLPALWGVAALLTLVAAAAMARAASGPRQALPRAVLAVNPVVVTVAIALAGLATELGRSFLAPAAPNLAHAVVFAWAARVLGSSALSGQR